MSGPNLETAEKVPMGYSPVTGERYFPHTFNCMQEIHELSQKKEEGIIYL